MKLQLLPFAVVRERVGMGATPAARLIATFERLDHARKFAQMPGCEVYKLVRASELESGLHGGP